MMKVLNVAEKPAIAAAIAEKLKSKSLKKRKGRCLYCPIYEFEYLSHGKSYKMIMTSVLGHIKKKTFSDEYLKWDIETLEDLFNAPIKEKDASDDSKKISETLKLEAKNAEMLIIWTDCDREGEAIGFSISEICKKVNSSICVKRARFSSTIKEELNNAFKNLDVINMKMVKAVDVRNEIDLRSGYIFTRLLTISVRKRVDIKTLIISYGGCQFPTLGFVVDHHIMRESFIKENYWVINLAVEKNGEKVNFIWEKGQVFDPHIALIFYSSALNSKEAIITNVKNKEIRKQKPLPLTTIIFQKFCTSYLKISSTEAMDHAESLYNRGYISYPRTETNRYSKKTDHHILIMEQVNDPSWKDYASMLLNNNNKFELPRNGNHDDKAHPPIHPKKTGKDLKGIERKIYEYIARSYLATCSMDAKGVESLVNLSLGDEMFYLKGIRIIEKNFLEIYPYQKWNETSIPKFELNEKIIPISCLLSKKVTSPPDFLYEHSLLNLMDKNGIGTDCTMHSHIEKLLTRKYIKIEKSRKIIPTFLGIGLILGFDKLNLKPSLTKPFVRRKMESDLYKIIDGIMLPNNVLLVSLKVIKDTYLAIKSNLDNLAIQISDSIVKQKQLMV